MPFSLIEETRKKTVSRKFKRTFDNLDIPIRKGVGRPPKEFIALDIRPIPKMQTYRYSLNVHKDDGTMNPISGAQELKANGMDTLLNGIRLGDRDALCRSVGGQWDAKRKSCDLTGGSGKFDIENVGVGEKSLSISFATEKDMDAFSKHLLEISE